jgi:hypothetical protein
MLATTWSKPIATKAMIGKKIASTLPETDVAASDIHTARHTSQLHPTARRNVSHAVCSVALPAAMEAMRSWVRAAVVPGSAPTSPTTPVCTARKNATNSAPTRLPSSTQREVGGDVAHADLAPHRAQRNQHHVAWSPGRSPR